jgi:hypothetical protein
MACFVFIQLVINLALPPCGNRQETFSLTSISDSLPKERMIRYQVDSSVHHTRQQLLLWDIAKVMGLPSISHGSAGMYIRIWLWDFGPRYVLNIIDDGTKKECSIVSWNSKIIDSVGYIVIHDEWKDLKPKSGWSHFFDSLNKFGIPTLTSGKPYPEHKKYLTEMSYVQFEIAQPGKYRYYEYLQPDMYRKVEVGSKKVHDFLKYFNEQMNVHIYDPLKNPFEEP